MKFFDTHTHSEFSPDSRLLLTEMAESFSNGLLSGIVVTDHYDVDVPEGKAYRYYKYVVKDE